MVSVLVQNELSYKSRPNYQLAKSLRTFACLFF